MPRSPLGSSRCRQRHIGLLLDLRDRGLVDLEGQSNLRLGLPSRTAQLAVRPPPFNSSKRASIRSRRSSGRAAITSSSLRSMSSSPCCSPPPGGEMPLMALSNGVLIGGPEREVASGHCHRPGAHPRQRARLLRRNNDCNARSSHASCEIIEIGHESWRSKNRA